MKKSFVKVITAIVLVFSLLASSAFAEGITDKTQRVSMSDKSAQIGKGINSNAFYDYVCAISPDGRYVAFISSSKDAASGAKDEHGDVYLYDRKDQKVSRVSVSSTGEEADDTCSGAAVSNGGQYVVFSSRASNLSPEVTPEEGFYNIYLHDLKSKETKAIALGKGDSRSALISGNNRYVIFSSQADNLVPDDNNHFEDVFLHDLETGITERVSISSDGSEANDDCFGASVSRDGRYVAFVSKAGTLTADSSAGIPNVYVRDRSAGTTTLITQPIKGIMLEEEASYISDYYGTSISGDGKFVAYASSLNNLVQNDKNESIDIFLYDMEKRQNRIISIANSGIQANRDSHSPYFAENGRYITYSSYAMNLVPGDPNTASDIFRYDMQTATTEVASISSGGAWGNHLSHNPTITADGRYIAFNSVSGNLVTGDTNASPDAFVRDMKKEVYVSLTAPEQISLNTKNIAKLVIKAVTDESREEDVTLKATYTSSDSKVIAVNKTTLTAVGKGTAKITVTFAGIKKEILFTVK